MIVRVLVYFLLGLTLHGCAGGPGMNPPSVLGIPLAEICEHYQVSWQWDPVTQVVLLAYKGNTAKALVGSPTVLMGQEKIILSVPLRRQQSTIYVPADFESQVLGPFTMQSMGLSSIESSARVHTIVLDAGHGGKDRGTIFPGAMNEKDIVLDIAKRLQVLLHGVGIKVMMTRSTDDFISLPERTQMVARSPADLFISIHVNSNQDRSVKGLLVYYIEAMGPRYLNEEERKYNERLFTESLNPEAPGRLKTIVSDMMNVLKSSQSQKLAKMIVREARQEGRIDVRGDGMRLCHFFVVRNTLVPAVLVETGFLSNRQDRSKLMLPEYRQKIAQVIARGVLDYAND